MTTEPPTNKGLLTDKEGIGFPGCRITVDGKDTPMTVLSFVQKYLDNIPKNTQVCFQTKDKKICKIWVDVVKTPDQVKASEDAAGDARMRENAESLAGSPAPKEDIKIVQGQITAIDQGIHTITVKDKTGTHHELIWAAPLNDTMAKLKQWWFVSISAEKSGEYWKVIDQTYFKRPDDWPAPTHGGGGKGYQPRNERIIVLQSCAKLAAEVWTHTHMKINDLDFDKAMDEIIARAIKDTETLMKEGGSS